MFSFSSQLPIRMTPSALSPILSIGGGVFWGKFMTPLAVCFGRISRTISFSSKGKAACVDMLFLGDCFFNAPSEIKPTGNGVPVNASFSADLRNGKKFSVKLNSAIAASIGRLLRFSGPSTIFGGISLVIVHSVYRTFFWAITHICVKCRKILPSFTYSYAATAVVVVKFIIGILASIFHSRPHDIDFGPRHSMTDIGGVNGLDRFSRRFLPQAAARIGFSAPYMVISNFFLIAALTLVKGVTFSAGFLHKLQHDFFSYCFGRISCHIMGD